MGKSVTLAAAAAALTACVFFGWRGMRPPDPARGPRLIPHRLLMLVSAAVVLVLVVHLLNLVGLATG